MSAIPAAIRALVLARDGYRCAASAVDATCGECQDAYGRLTARVPVGQLQLDHVRDEPMMGSTAPSDVDHLVTLCPWHHLGLKAGSNWATSHRPELREYLARKNGPVYIHPPLGLTEVPHG